MGELAEELRAVLARDDDYVAARKAVCDYDDAAARVELVDALAKDALAALAVLHGRELSEAVAQAGALVATVTGQDLDEDEAGVFRIARRVGKDRVISTVDPQARHGHKTAARGFDGYKGHLGIDPDSEIITATAVTAGNAGDASAAQDLITDLLITDTDERGAVGEPDAGVNVEQSGQHAATAGDTACVYGDNAYGTGELQERLERAGIESRQDPAAGRRGRHVRQGPLRHRSARRHGAVPRRAHRTDPA